MKFDPPSDQNQKSGYTPQKKVFDVMRPGKAPASPTSRPVVPNREVVKDPDVTTDHDTDRRSLLDPKRKIIVQPAADALPEKQSSSDDAKKSADEKVATTEQKDAATEQPVTDEANQNESSPASPAETDRPLTTAEAPNIGRAAVDSVQSEAEDPKTEAEEPIKPTSSEPLHMDLPDNFNPGKIVVSHHHSHRTLFLEIIAVLIILLLLAAIANFLLDAGIITTNLGIPHTDFFSS